MRSPLVLQDRSGDPLIGRILDQCMHHSFEDKNRLTQPTTFRLPARDQFIHLFIHPPIPQIHRLNNDATYRLEGRRGLADLDRWGRVRDGAHGGRGEEERGAARGGGRRAGEKAEAVAEHHRFGLIGGGLFVYRCRIGLERAGCGYCATCACIHHHRRGGLRLSHSLTTPSPSLYSADPLCPLPSSRSPTKTAATPVGARAASEAKPGGIHAPHGPNFDAISFLIGDTPVISAEAVVHWIKFG